MNGRLTNDILLNPIHISPQQLCYVCNIIDDPNFLVMLSPKADGITSVFKFEKFYLNSEDVNNIKFVYDTISYPTPHNNNLQNRIKFIKNLFRNYINKQTLVTDYTETNKLNLNKFYDPAFYIVRNKTNVDEIIDYDNKVFDFYYKNYSIKWFPKTWVVINGSNDNIANGINFINIIDEQPKTMYPTDGWILSVYFNNKLCFNGPLKIKPPDLMTVDLLYKPSDNNQSMTLNKINNFYTSNGNSVDNIMLNEILNPGIYRCKFDEKNKIFRIDSQRNDKDVPNNDIIVNDIITYHTNKHFARWIPSDIIKYLNSIKLYYPVTTTKKLISPIIKEYLDMRHDFVNNTMREVIHNNHFVLDIGCGNCSSLNGFSCIKYIGLDKDVGCLYRAHKNMKSIKNNFKLIWGDILEIKWGYFDDTIFKHTYDIILMINTIHIYKHKTNSLNTVLLQNLNAITKKGSKIIIITIDDDKICEININDELSIEKETDKKYKFKYKWIDNEMIEGMFSSNEIIQSFELYGWKYCKNNKIDNMIITLDKSIEMIQNHFSDHIRKFNSFHDILIFEKL